MSEENVSASNRAADKAAERYANQMLSEARYAAETCCCPNCVGNYELWLNWFELKEQRPNNPRLLPPPSDFPHAAGPSGPNDDPPPDINSGNLSEWYSKGL